jgi:hypothetical protein
MKSRMPGIRLELPEGGSRLRPNLWRQRSEALPEVGIST